MITKPIITNLISLLLKYMNKVQMINKIPAPRITKIIKRYLQNKNKENKSRFKRQI